MVSETHNRPAFDGKTRVAAFIAKLAVTVKGDNSCRFTRQRRPDPTVVGGRARTRSSSEAACGAGRRRCWLDGPAWQDAAIVGGTNWARGGGKVAHRAERRQRRLNGRVRQHAAIAGGTEWARGGGGAAGRAGRRW